MSASNKPIRVATCNLEMDGGGGRTPRWEACHQLLRSLDLDLLYRQEMKFSADETAPDRKGDLMRAAEHALGMRGFIGAKRPNTTQLTNYTGIFIRQSTFEFGTQHSITLPWHLPPCHITVRLAGGAWWAIASFHAAYYSPIDRAREAYWLTTLPDKVGHWAMMAGDTNSDPVPLAGEPPATPAYDFPDKPHRAHRFLEGPDGTLVRDQELDKILHRAGMVDPAKVMALRGVTEVLAGTAGHARNDQGEKRRIDRLYMPDEFEPALQDVEIIPNPHSDHDIVMASFNRDMLTEITAAPPASHAERIRWAAVAGTSQATLL